ncbi:MAG: hypothetical protein KDB23_29965, partial [Planctomycetales bacterium]|nr:hypothetical protein [Planctomycetales bacterium]
MIQRTAHDIDAECHVLGIMSQNEDAFRQGCARLTVDDFTDSLNRVWFTVLSSHAALSLEVRMIESIKDLRGAHPGGSKHIGRLMIEFGAMHRVPNVFR